MSQDQASRAKYLRDEITMLIANEQNPDFLYAVRNYILGLKKTG